VHATLEVVFIPEVAVTALRANASSLNRQFRRDRDRSLVIRSQHDPSDAIRTALVINDRQGPKLTQTDEPGPRQEAVTRDLLPAGDIGHQRQPGEIVSRQESLAGQ